MHSAQSTTRRNASRQPAFRTASCDVLVLGSGLAGLRAAWAAAQATGHARVLLATAAHGPSGSSFTNRNARLGFLAPGRDEHREALAARALDIAAPGWAEPSLVSILMGEAADRLAELTAMGAPLQRDGAGMAMRHPSCFARDIRCARVVSDLPNLYGVLMTRVRELGVQLLQGHTAMEIITSPGHGACGALLVPAKGEAPLAVRAGAVVAALGGPAPLFAANIAGMGGLEFEPSRPDGAPTQTGPRCWSGPVGAGWSHALLRRAGAELANEGYIQFFWSREDTGEFVPISRLAEPGAAVVTPDGGVAALPPDIARLAPERATHCPAAWGMPDAALDRFAASLADENGVVTLRLPQAHGASAPATIRALPMAHCGNGGARVDAQAATTVPGLYAAGECATGMHGANRLGGAMAAATQVFGARAGRSAARHALDREQISDISFTELMNCRARPIPSPHAQPTFPVPTRAGANALAKEKQLLKNIINSLAKQNTSTPTKQARLDVEAALTAVRFLHKII